MNLNIYLILLVVLLIFNLIFWILVIWFRIFFECGGGICSFRTRRTRTRGSRDAESGHGNQAFVDEEDPARTRQRPYNIEERMESPPSYEEALKYDAFGFRHPVVHAANNITLERSNVQNQPSITERHSAPVTLAVTPTASTPQISPLQSTSMSSTEHGARPRSNTPSSSGTTPHLSPIREEEYDDAMPVTVVIDCIGVQASRLLENCDNHVQLTNGEELRSHSKC